jgi:outer membrane lipoprotein-sorting protein
MEPDRLRQNRPAAAPARAILQRRIPAAGLFVALLLSSCSTPPPPPPTAAEQAEIDRITAYLNSIPQFTARFIQSGSFGPDSGVVRVDRPAGHLRVDYAAPDQRVMVIADGRVQIVDRSNGATTTMPLSRTPLGMLLTPSLDLSGAVTVARLVRTPGLEQITLEKTGHPSDGSLTLILSDQPLRLRAVTVIDREQQTLTMSLFDLDPAQTLPPDLFQPPVPPAGS